LTDPVGYGESRMTELLRDAKNLPAPRVSRRLPSPSPPIRGKVLRFSFVVDGVK
jgi:hypothetical protein